MRTRKKWLWLVVAFVVVAGALIWSFAAHRPAVILTLPNGDQYRFVGITYGTNTLPPLLTAKVLNLLPVKMADAINKKLGSPLPPFASGPWIAMRVPPVEPVYRFWFRRIGMTTNLGPFAVSAAPKTTTMVSVDQSGHPGGQTAFLNSYGGQYSVVAVSVLPRRDPQLDCRFYTHDASFPLTVPQTDITIPNPFYGHFPQWTPEPLPALKHDGDLQVQLDDMSFVHQPSTPFGSIKFDFSVRSHIDAYWALDQLELDDATSNHLQQKFSQAIAGRPNYEPDIWAYRTVTVFGTLWPDENAWRAEFTLKRTTGFDSNELVTITNIPIPASGSTNSVSVTNDGRVTTVAFSGATLLVGITSGSGGGGGGNTRTSAVFASWHDAPGSVMDCLDATTDAGDIQLVNNSGSISSSGLILEALPPNAQTMTLTFAIQKPRTVEFLVKPPKSD